MYGPILLVGLLTLAVAPGAQAETRDADRECREVKRQIARVHARMRSGYSARTGNRLAARLRELQKKRARVCR